MVFPVAAGRPARCACPLSPKPRVKQGHKVPQHLSLTGDTGEHARPLHARLFRYPEAIEAAALELGTRRLPLLRRREGTNAHAVEGAHVANHRLVNLRLALADHVAVAALDLDGHL